jgi:hypothetical protein
MDANPRIFQWIEPLPLELGIHCASLIESSKRKAAWLLFTGVWLRISLATPQVGPCISYATVALRMPFALIVSEKDGRSHRPITSSRRELQVSSPTVKLVPTANLACRCFDFRSYKSNLGDQDSYVINRISGSWGLCIVRLWGETDLPHGGCPWLLPRSCARSLWSQSRCSSIHGL